MLTILFVVPLWRRNIVNSFVKRIAHRSLIASIICLTASTVRLTATLHLLTTQTIFRLTYSSSSSVTAPNRCGFASAFAASMYVRLSLPELHPNLATPDYCWRNGHILDDHGP